MGTSRTPAEFAGKIVKMAAETDKRAKVAVGEGAFAVKQLIIAEAGSKGVMPTSRIAGGKWSVGYDVVGVRNPSALVRIRGPFHLVERDTKPHTITPRKRRRKGRTARALTIGDGFAASAQHPGTRGKKIFATARVKADRVVPEVMARSLRQGWKDALR